MTSMLNAAVHPRPAPPTVVRTVVRRDKRWPPIPAWRPPPVDEHFPVPEWPASPSIVDDVIDLLEPLPLGRRWGLIAYMSQRYYDGWRPDRDEIADLVAVELGRISFDDYLIRAAQRHARRSNGPDPEHTKPPLCGDHE